MDIKNTTDSDIIHVRRLRWGAIFAGALIMLVIMMLLSLLGIGIGFGSLDIMEEPDPAKGLGTGALIYWVISNIIAVFAGGFVAGKLMSTNFKGSGYYHGILAWSVYTLISFFVLTTAVGAIFSGVGKVVTKSVSGIGSGIGSLISGVDKNVDVQGVLNQAGIDQKDMDKVKDQLTDVLKQVFIKNGKLNTDVTRDDIEKAVTQNTQLKPDQVQRISNKVDSAYQSVKTKFEEMKQKAKETADKVAAATSKAAIWSFIALLFGAIVSAIGGKVGESTEDTVYESR
jgi:hypothetical protein